MDKRTKETTIEFEYADRNTGAKNRELIQYDGDFKTYDELIKKLIDLLDTNGYTLSNVISIKIREEVVIERYAPANVVMLLNGRYAN